MKMVKNALALAVFLFFPLLIIAQQNTGAKEPGIKPEKVFVNQEGKIYVKSKTPIYIRLTTSNDNNAPSYLLRNQASEGPQVTPKPFFFEGHGKHSLVHPPDHKEIQNRKGPHLFYIFDDARAPKTAISVTKAPLVINKNINIYGKPVKISLHTIDADSGVFAKYFALNSNEFSVYGQPVSLEQEIEYALKYYAVDNVGNISKTGMISYSLDFTPPETVQKIMGKHVQVDGLEILAPSARISLKSRDLKAGVKQIRYSFKGEKAVYQKKSLGMKGLKDGPQKIVFAAEDRVENVEQNKTFSFYLDRIRPVVQHALLGDRYESDKKIYVSGRSTVALTAMDNKAGIDQIRYYFKSRKGMIYQQPFIFPAKNGKLTFRYAASDKVGNISKTVKQNVIVDISPPRIRLSFKGEHYYSRKTHYIRSSTEISLPTTDNLSGIQSVSYSLDQSADVMDQKPFNILLEGTHILTYRAVDNVQNRKDDKTISLFVDEKAPELFHLFSVNSTIPNQEVYPLKSLLFLSATDKQAGIRHIFYQINDGEEKKYTKTLLFKERISYQVKIRAVDNVGNISTRQVDFKID